MECESKTPYIGRAIQGVLVDQNRVFSKRLTMRLLQRCCGYGFSVFQKQFFVSMKLYSSLYVS